MFINFASLNLTVLSVKGPWKGFDFSRIFRSWVLSLKADNYKKFGQFPDLNLMYFWVQPGYFREKVCNKNYKNVAPDRMRAIAATLHSIEAVVRNNGGCFE